MTSKDGLSVEFVKQKIAAKNEVVDRLMKPSGGDIFLFKDEKGNSKSSRNFLSAAPSTRKTLLSQATTKTFKNLLLESANDVHQFQPRSGKQVQYYKSIAANDRKIGADAIVTLLELSYAMPDYVWSITAYPDLVVCFGLQSLIDFIPTGNPPFLSYDTTFNLGDFYLSVLTLKLSFFNEAPCVPVAFMIHERKFESVHSHFCDLLKRRMRRSSSDIILVTDGELAIVAAFKDRFPNWNMVSCWNHILSDIEVWLKRHDGKASDVVVYKSNVRDILNSEQEGELSSKLSTFEHSWSEAFVEHYHANLTEKVESSYLGRLRRMKLDCDSVTTNMSESLNFVIKDFLTWKEKTADLTLVSLYELQHYYVTQITRSRHGFGPYQLGSDFKDGALNDCLGAIPSTIDLQAIISTVRAAANGQPVQTIPSAIQAFSSTLKVVHVPELHVFNVCNSQNHTNSVTLFPNETCTCPASTTCCHIIAAKRSIGLDAIVRKPMILAKLRKNSRKNNDKTSGRKKPRTGDLCFSAAPDSTASQAEVRSTFHELDHAYANNGEKTESQRSTENVNVDRSTLNNLEPVTPGTPSTVTVMDDCDHLSISIDEKSEETQSQKPDSETAFLELLDDSQRLTDSIINAAQTLLKSQNADVAGFLDTVVVAACDAKLGVANPSSGIVQIVFDNAHEHWLTVTNQNSCEGHISVYCGLQMIPSKQCVESIARLFGLQQSSMTIDVMNTVKQIGVIDCGLFAIAHAEMLIRQQDPRCVVFKQSEMRSHLHHCLKQRRIDPFPLASYRTTRRPIVRSTTVKLYCLCRSTYAAGDNMLQCSQCTEWFHQKCLGLTDIIFKYYSQVTVTYACPRCSHSNHSSDSTEDNQKKAQETTPVVGAKMVSSEATEVKESDVGLEDQSSLICTFLSFVEDARKASAWLEKNKQLLRSEVNEPWVVSASDEEIFQYIEDQRENDSTFDDVRDNFLFNFDDPQDIDVFIRETKVVRELRVNVCLFGSEYLSNNMN